MVLVGLFLSNKNTSASLPMAPAPKPINPVAEFWRNKAIGTEQPTGADQSRAIPCSGR